MLAGASARGGWNANWSWLGGRGVWLSYLVGVVALHLSLLAIPVLSVATAWTLTALVHNMLNFVLLHCVKGTPWQDCDQGSSSFLTHWEQIDAGQQNTPTRKFLISVPVILFIMASFYTDYNISHFIVNLASLLLALVPKLPVLHRRRLFGINRY